MSGPITSTLQIGEYAPDWTLPDVAGQPHTFSKSLGARGAVVIFVRGMFCPYCTEQVCQLWEGAPQFRQRGVQPLVITPYGPGALAVAAALVDTQIPVLVDSQRSVIDSYGLCHDIEQFASKGYPSGDLVHPSTLLVDAVQTIRWLYVGQNYADRPRMHDVLRAIDAMAANAQAPGRRIEPLI